MDEKLLSIGEAAKLMDVHKNTLRDWDIEKKFKAHRTAGGHRRYTLKQIREYLDDKSTQPLGGCKSDIIKKWEAKGYLDDCESKNDKENLAILLDNCYNHCCHDPSSNKVFSTNQILWLTQQGWLRSKFKKIVSVQTMSGPASILYTKKKNKANSIVLDSVPVAAKATKYNFSIFPKADFEKIKDIYADAIANGIDLYIISNIPNKCNPEVFLDFSTATGEKIDNEYDYIITSEEITETLKKRKNFENINLYSIPPILDPETFTLIAVAGKFPKSYLDPPIFAPYILALETPITAANVAGLFMRTGWHGEDEK